MEKPKSIEQANVQLEETIRQLENEALPLEDSVKLYSEACELMAYCMEQLNGYKGRIEDATKKLAQITAGEDAANDESVS